MGNGKVGEDNGEKPYQEKEEMKLWGIIVFALIGATATTFARENLSKKWSVGTTMDGSQPREVELEVLLGQVFRRKRGKRYNRRMREEYEEENGERERIRRMQSVFNRERNKYKRGAMMGAGKKMGKEAPSHNATYPLSHHYSVLGLDRFRTKPYTDIEIKVCL
ncbi:hypothetical protein HAX54_038307 [Datura stramonium]|uniref:Uncharacterized protein n=1 Tax=Datura stramonium TaxID=4076 RepID=A0ABS8VJK6_DATST|nr:hypothetical protein [Datura stramonium]